MPSNLSNAPRATRRQPSKDKGIAINAVNFIGTVFFIASLGVLISSVKWWSLGEQTTPTATELSKAQAATLVTYVFSDTDPEYFSNLAYFVKEGIKVCTAYDPFNGMSD
jgi:hypothetical protein